MFTYEDLLNAYFSCRSNKRLTCNALKFEQNFERNLTQLHKELCDRTYFPGKSVCFVVTYPKLREVFAADFRDRVVHHLLVSRLEPYFEKRFVHTSFACRKNKGTLSATKYVEASARTITKNYHKQAYYGQFDIKSFFTSINKSILEKIICKAIQTDFPVKEQDGLIWLIKTVIHHNPTTNYYLKGDPSLIKQIPAHKTLFKVPVTQGLPIGNLTSQFFANLYLNELDKFIKRELKVKYYARYADDFVIIKDNLEEIIRLRPNIDKFLRKNLKLQLHPDKDVYGSIYGGMNFVGYIIKPKYILSRSRVVKNLKSKLYLINKGFFLVTQKQEQRLLPLSMPLSTAELSQILAMINSYYGHFKHANCYNLRRDIYLNHFGILQKHFKPVAGCLYFTLAKKRQ